MVYGAGSRGKAINSTKKRNGRVGGWAGIQYEWGGFGGIKKSVRNLYRYIMMWI